MLLLADAAYELTFYRSVRKPTLTGRDDSLVGSSTLRIVPEPRPENKRQG